MVLFKINVKNGNIKHYDKIYTVMKDLVKDCVESLKYKTSAKRITSSLKCRVLPATTVEVESSATTVEVESWATMVEVGSWATVMEERHDGGGGELGDDSGGGELGDDGGGGELGDGDGGEVRRWRWRAGRLRWRSKAPRRRWRRGATAMRGYGLCEGERVRETEILTEGGGWWQLGI
ncbi:hypothetical protein HN873_031921 [Arachis hypogaea]